MVIDIPSGAQSGKVYLVNYGEDLWKALDDERREFCKTTWLDRAKHIADVRFVVLRLHPDDLFPMHGHEKPYVEWQAEIDRPPERGFHIETCVTVTTLDDSKYVHPVMRSKISLALEGEARPGTLWRIVNKSGEVIERGKL